MEGRAAACTPPVSIPRLKPQTCCAASTLWRDRTNMPRKILHVMGKMDRAGVETWLMHVVRNMDRERFETHFLVHDPAEGAYDREILSLGGHIHRGPDPKRPLQYARRFRELVRTHGPFEVLHSHVYWYSGVVLRLGHQSGIPIRIAQSHTARSTSNQNVLRRLYTALM